MPSQPHLTSDVDGMDTSVQFLSRPWMFRACTRWLKGMVGGWNRNGVRNSYQAGKNLRSTRTHTTSISFNVIGGQCNEPAPLTLTHVYDVKSARSRNFVTHRQKLTMWCLNKSDLDSKYYQTC
ncbi:hypothetical protein BD410DRAFT_809380 [Rickenella mellea]|uniref:Uncharacterized protein n=1 Tax=Rickenella mellea TaxID=50990 RepID=A0A4Y7PHD7_9AGAM|nr:hypothetical protein BD410DRAFT_809380 [Rickenella mellea]